MQLRRSNSGTIYGRERLSDRNIGRLFLAANQHYDIPFEDQVSKATDGLALNTSGRSLEGETAKSWGSVRQSRAIDTTQRVNQMPIYYNSYLS